MTTPIRELFDLPLKMADLPRDERGFPVPKFVQWAADEQGTMKPDFRLADLNHLRRCVVYRCCWLCGQAMGVNKVFVIGPMCCVNRISSEPPCHYDCAYFAARNCPFLTKPLARRRDTSDLPDTHAAGIMIDRNPGVCALWVTHDYKTFDANGLLFQLGKPERVEFYSQGRRATREEVSHSVDTGLPLLRDMARREGRKAMQELQRLVDEFDILMRGVR
jgi:hypothetical protein